MCWSVLFYSGVIPESGQGCPGVGSMLWGSVWALCTNKATSCVTRPRGLVREWSPQLRLGWPAEDVSSVLFLALLGVGSLEHSVLGCAVHPPPSSQWARRRLQPHGTDSDAPGIDENSGSMALAVLRGSRCCGLLDTNRRALRGCHVTRLSQSSSRA